MSTLSLRKIKHDSSTVDNITLNSNGSTIVNNLSVINSTNPTSWVSVDSGLTTQSMYLQANTTSGDVRVGSYTSHPFGLYTNNIERIRIDTSGRVTKPYQPLFSGKLSNGTVPGSSARITTITVDINVGNHWNGSTGLFTCPVAGKYLVSSTVMKNAGAGSVIHVDIYKNGSWLGNYRNRLSDASNYQQSSLTTIVDCATNDTLEFQWFGGCNALTTHDAFLIHLIS